MAEQELIDLVDRLRSVTGHSIIRQTVQPLATRKISDGCLLVLKQSLLHHPAVALIPHAQFDAERALLKLVEQAQKSNTSSSNEIGQLLCWINEESASLEAERLSLVYKEPFDVIRGAKAKLFSRLGVNELELDFSMNADASPSPWNVLATVLSGPVCDTDFVRYQRETIEVPSPTPAITANLQHINSNCYNTVAWTNLLQLINEFPVSSVRAVWQAALYFFPSCGPLALVYVRKEMAELALRGVLRDCGDEDEAKALFRDHLRVLNTFYRHLPICFSCDLYALFFDFLTKFVEPDHISLNALYCACLVRDVGNLPHSTQLWTRYIALRAASFHDNFLRKKRMYLRVLQVPLVGIDKIKESYDTFIQSEMRGTVPFEEKVELEKRYVRVRAAAFELVKFFSIIFPSTVSSSGRDPQEGPPADLLVLRNMYLPRPLGSSIGGAEPTTDAATDNPRELALSRVEADLWACWYALLEQMRQPQSMREMAVYRNYLMMRACQLPHQVNCWVELADFCARPHPQEEARTVDVATVLQLSKRFLPQSTCLELFSAHIYSTQLDTKEAAYRGLRSALMREREALVEYIRLASVSITCSEILQHLVNIAVLAVNWMRMSTTNGARYHIALVARSVMHQVDFLSLTMAVLKKCLQSGITSEPTLFLRPFNTFCYHWLELELVRNRNSDTALTILKQWIEHLDKLVRSAKGKSWSPAMCGLDDLIMQACLRVVSVDGANALTVCQLVRALRDACTAAENCTVEWATYCDRFEHLCLSVDPRRNCDSATYASFNLPHLPLCVRNAATTRYDTELFHNKLYWNAEHLRVSEEEIHEAPSIYEFTGAVSDSTHTVDACPEEGLWHSSDTGQQSAGSRFFGRKRRRDDEGASPPASLPAHPQLSARPRNSRRAFLVQATRLVSLDEQLTNLNVQTSERVGGGGGGGASQETTRLASGRGGKSRTLPSIFALEALITELPTVHQYWPESENKSAVSTEWLVDILGQSESI